MSRHIESIALVVRDYDEVIDFYTTKLGFDLVEDSPLADGKRWVLVAPPGSGKTRLLLAKAANQDGSLTTLAMAGRQAVLEGLTTPDEVSRVATGND